MAFQLSAEGDPWPTKDHWVRPTPGQSWTLQQGILLPPAEALLMGLYSVEEEDRRLREEEQRRSSTIDPQTGRPPRHRRFFHPSLVTEFALLPVVGERKQHYGKERIVLPHETSQSYLEWLNRWGSLGILRLRYHPLGTPDTRTKAPRLEEQEWQDRRTGERLLGESVVPRYLAEYKDSLSRMMYHPLLERVSVMEMSQEVFLLRCTLTLASYLGAEQGDEGAPSLEEAAFAAEVLVGQIGGPVRSNELWDAFRWITLFRTSPETLQRMCPSGNLDLAPRLRTILAFWLDLHHTTRLAFKPDTSPGTTVRAVWRHQSFLAALYHLLALDLSGGFLLRRCPSCSRFFRPKRDATYCSELCYDRERKRAASSK